ncbi:MULTISPECIES: DUF6624 domain-containing protein [Streptomyces]|uniref:DUF6624 domain-containing protein n=1 Tax=Streptomyces TaxID=1883 RepID=UPI00163C8829|nr:MULTISPECIES: DUF6624 domain-containing protein [Streptomyces]MBC2877238.1 hypothetical protein [Streptomyces sp. TYQ1024]UBI39504.1 hypothetical protein K7I03_25555 [Streptomyces mobaraensis]UKW32083.1 hypothetical protein MCU78_25490 [Streptomyces sp. TYQ1024]
MTAAMTALAAELESMAADDHRAAARAHDEDPAGQLAWRRLTARNGDRLNEIMDAHGWPAADLVGPDAARAAWLIAQHADRQLDVQRRALRLLEQAVAEGRAAPRELAFLRDRTLVNEGREQVYGTQIAGVRDGAPVPWPCEDPERMDERRAEVGIEPFATYVARFPAP